MDSAKSQLIDRLKTANSILVTVSANPSVDQLAACIGLTLLINKLDKHSSAVFSGNIPSTIEFLKPEETLEKTPDSLRDFIIALDKSKADKLRYKVEDQMVKIFITPYRTSLTEDDFEFSQGDFNIELVIALGVQKQEDLDQAIVAHGRILHDATVACINTIQPTDIGNISWQEPTASSLCELVADLAMALGDELLDGQISTALLTGIVAETNRFSNEKTSPQTMSVSSKLMSSGANQQLVATNLSVPVSVKELEGQKKPANNGQSDAGALNIEHDNNKEAVSATQPAPSNTENLQIEGENQNSQGDVPELETQDNSDETLSGQPKLVTEPPALGGTLTANTMPEYYEQSSNPMSNAAASTSPSDETTAPKTLPVNPPSSYTPPPPDWVPPTPPLTPPATSKSAQDLTLPTTENKKDKAGETLEQLEQDVNSPHLRNKADNARGQVESDKDLDLNAIPLGEPLHEPPKEPEKTANPNNTTGLDPSLFSELPSKDSVPPVPPPLNIPMENPPSNGGNNNPPASS
jgi:nanoRNase/pAp phosphatase (c-di-AMP/oligoRNAs hydrolase)